MAEIIGAEFAATLRPSIRTFHTLSIGKIGHDDAPGMVGGLTSPARVIRTRSRVGVAADAGPTMTGPTSTKTISVSDHFRRGRRYRGVGMAAGSRAATVGGDGTEVPSPPHRGQVRMRTSARQGRLSPGTPPARAR
jgi:hypothetical protein